MKIITKLIILFLMLPSFSLAASYCLSKSNSLFKAKREIQTILLPDEKVFINSSSHCLNISVRDYRKGLVSKYLRMSFNVISETDGAYVPRKTCKVQLKKVTDGKTKGKSLQVGSKLDIRDSISNLNTTSNMQMILMEGREGKISMDESSLNVTCRKAGSGFELVFSLDRAGTTMISTQAYIGTGQWLNVGEISKDLNNKVNNKSLSDGIEYRKTTGNQKTTYFLTVVD
jgi:hypothetical protein